MMKSERQSLIREIIAAQPVRTQSELADALRAHGLAVTQATVSRDIKDMHLIKVQSEDGEYRYALGDRGDPEVNSRLTHILTESVLSIENAANLFVVRTLSGSAHVAAEAIDSLHWPEVLGTIAGDNTILLIAKSDADVEAVRGHFADILR